MMRNQTEKSPKVCVANLQTGEVLRLRTQAIAGEFVSELIQITGGTIGYAGKSKLFTWQYVPKAVYKQYILSLQGVLPAPRFEVKQSVPRVNPQTSKFETAIEDWFVHFYEAVTTGSQKHHKTRKPITKIRGVKGSLVEVPEQEFTIIGRGKNPEKVRTNKRVTLSKYAISKL